MKITRDNYEEYFMVYKDGLLTEEENEELMLFLSQNPDLNEILETFDPYSAINDLFTYIDNNKLSEIPFQPIKITDENFDGICIMHINGELNQAQSRELEQYLQKHPEKQEDYNLYTKTIFKPDPNIEYEDEDKDKLINHYISLNRRNKLYTTISIAASILLILSFYFIINNHINNNKNNSLAKHEKSGINTELNKKIKHIEPNKSNNKETYCTAKNNNTANQQTKTLRNEISNLKTAIINKQTIDSSLVKTNNIDKNNKIIKIEPRTLKPVETSPPTPSIVNANTQITNKIYRTADTNTTNNLQPITISNRKTLWDLTSKILNAILKHSDNNIELKNTYNSKGEIQTMALSTENIAIKIKRNNN
jgi:hypothetical protein